MLTVVACLASDGHMAVGDLDKRKKISEVSLNLDVLKMALNPQVSGVRLDFHFDCVKQQRACYRVYIHTYDIYISLIMNMACLCSPSVLIIHIRILAFGRLLRLQPRILSSTTRPPSQ